MKLLGLDSVLLLLDGIRLRDRLLELRRHQVDGQRVEEERLLASVEGRGFAFAAFGPGTWKTKLKLVFKFNDILTDFLKKIR